MAEVTTEAERAASAQVRDSQRSEAPELIRRRQRQPAAEVLSQSFPALRAGNLAAGTDYQITTAEAAGTDDSGRVATGITLESRIRRKIADRIGDELRGILSRSRHSGHRGDAGEIVSWQRLSRTNISVHGQPKSGELTK